MALAYHIPKPKPPFKDGRTWGLMVPAVIGVVGLAAFALLAFAFPELSVLPSAFRTNAVVIGSIALAIGGEIGTLFTNIEIFRKVTSKDVTFWDWTALATSLLATMISFLIAAAALLGVTVVWTGFVTTWGQILLIIVVALDQYAAQMELGLYIGTHDARMKKWRKNYEDWLFGMAVKAGTAEVPTRVSLAPALPRKEPDMSDTQEFEPVPRPVEKKKRGRPKKKPASKGTTSYEGIEEVEDGWNVTCTVCGWTGKSPYPTEKRAKQALGGHKYFCPTTVKLNGDF